MLGTPPAFILSQDQTLMFVCLPGQNSFLLLLRGCFRFLFLSGFLPASFLTGSSGFSFPSLYCFFFVSFSELFFRIFRAALLFICQGSSSQHHSTCDFHIISECKIIVNIFIKIFLLFFQNIVEAQFTPAAKPCPDVFNILQMLYLYKL